MIYLAQAKSVFTGKFKIKIKLKNELVTFAVKSWLSVYSYKSGQK